MGEVDTAFIQDPEHMPNLSPIQVEGMPIIDLSPITNHTVSDPSAIESLVKDIGSACKEWGFFQVTNHGVPLSVRQRIEEASRLFFAQSLEEKRKYIRDEISPTGYHDRPHQKPLGLGRHTDAGALTVLAQDEVVGGLEVKRKADQEWVGVKPTPNTYIINVGDIIQVILSGVVYGAGLEQYGAYESVEHRVIVNSEKERFSIPFFFHPAHYTVVKPLEELTNEKNPPKYRPYKWGKFIVRRRAGNFQKLNVENIQISHYKIA
ncbi:hypothetical protein Fmac_006159 [Flemingia macrophylla]|uniref:Fe2OG dioxygenase domain-containing protein n=1 Tax=Flemingia macrophylla TaxID=520843 RepID=A0ABD1N9S3_9FABA